MTSIDTPWLQTAKKKRELRDTAMLNFLNRTTAGDDKKFTGMDAIGDIQHALLSSDVTAQALCIAYIHRAVEAQRRTNCLTEILFEDALQQAKDLDDFFKKTGRLLGPLHGVPMTLKDQFDVRGYDSTLGYVGRAFKPALQDCVLVSVLKQLGAVIVAKSNLPQSIMWCETDNPLWGATVHPLNPEFTVGGSTGGEGALLALHASVVGWGTDLGGSIRIPSHMNGLYGFKPSSTRLPYQGVAVSTEGQEHVPSVIGPISRNMDSLIATTKAVINASPWDHDPKCTPIPWRSGAFIEVQCRPLVIAVMPDDGVVKVHPPVARVLKEVADKLGQAGHELVPWEPGSLHQECIDIMDQYYTADGCEDIRKDIDAGGEPYIPHVESLVNKGKAISVYDYWQLNKQKMAAQKRYLDLWNSTKSPESGKQIDILIAPAMPHSAVPHRQCKWVGYTKVFNFIDYPAVVIPAGKVSKDVDADAAKDMGSYQPRNALDEWNWKTFDLDTMHGMPIGVQVITRRLQEEKALGAAKAIDELLRGEVRSLH